MGFGIAPGWPVQVRLLFLSHIGKRRNKIVRKSNCGLEIQSKIKNWHKFAYFLSIHEYI